MQSELLFFHSGYFGSLDKDAKRNYLARGELQSYLVSILKQQFSRILSETPKNKLSESSESKTEDFHLAADHRVLSACFECVTARKKLIKDSHFKVIAFCR